MERSERTVEKYIHDIRRFSEFVGDMDLTKAVVLCFKDALRKEMSPVSANSILAAVNNFLKFLEVPQFCVKDNSPLVLNILCKIALNLVSQAQYKRISKRRLMFHAALEPTLFLDILFDPASITPQK